MKTLLPLILLAGITSGVFYFMNTTSEQKSSDINLVELADFAFQEARYDDAKDLYLKAAAQGEPEAQYQLSQIFEKGLGVERNDEMALHWIKKASSSGLAKAEFSYANMLEFGRGLELPQPKQSLKWYQKSASHGYPEAMLKVARIYFEDKLVNHDAYEALGWALKAEKDPSTKSKAAALRQQIVKHILNGAEQGNSEDQYIMSVIYSSGKGIEKNPAKAIRWLKASAKSGHSKAQFELGKVFAKKYNRQNKSLYWLHKSAQQGNVEAGYAIAALLDSFPEKGLFKEAWRWLYHGIRAQSPKVQYNLATILHKGSLSLPKNDTHFVPWLESAARQNITFAQNDISIFHTLKQQNNKQNLEWLTAAANSGDVMAQFNLGLLYARGEGLTPNDESALQWWQEADKRGNIKAPYMIGLLYHIGRGTGRDEKKAAKWYQKAIENNDALYNLAMIFYLGRGVEQDYKKAAYYLERLADKGDAQAQNIYASLFLDGKGVEYSPKSALSWFERAAKNGNVQGMFNLATLYRSGTGTKQNDNKAMFWYLKAAAKNYAPAQNALGYMYAEGRGIKKDLDKAEEWFYKASDNGLKIAEKNLNSLSHGGTFSLVTIQINESIHSAVLTNKQINLNEWLEVHHQPIL